MAFPRLHDFGAEKYYKTLFDDAQGKNGKNFIFVHYVIELCKYNYVNPVRGGAGHFPTRAQMPQHLDHFHPLGAKSCFSPADERLQTVITIFNSIPDPHLCI